MSLIRTLKVCFITITGLIPVQISLDFKKHLRRAARGEVYCPGSPTGDMQTHQCGLLGDFENCKKRFENLCNVNNTVYRTHTVERPRELKANIDYYSYTIMYSITNPSLVTEAMFAAVGKQREYLVIKSQVFAGLSLVICV